jgi:hypothetical protein
MTVLDMSSWDELRVDVVGGIQLDPKNVRLGADAKAPEPDIISDLFHNEKAFALVDGIVKVGYLTHEYPIVVRRNRKLVVVEGNRRVAALKAIQNPFLVPEFQGRITALVQNLANRDALRMIQVKRAPTQDAADQLIAALHTSNQRVAWSPSRQVAFFQAQIDSGKTLQQLEAAYPTVDVRSFIIRSNILNLFRGGVANDPTLMSLLSQRTFPLTVLSRIYESKEFIDLTGLAVDNSGRVQISIDAEAFSRMAHNILEGIKDKDITTRSVNTVGTPRFKKLIEELKGLSSPEADPEDMPPLVGPVTTPSPAAQGSSSSESQTTGSGPGNNREPADGPTPQGASAASGTPPKKKSTGRFLNTSQLTIPAAFPRPVELVLEELSLLDVKRFPNATFDLIRTFLEKSIKAYAESKQEDIQKSGKSQNGYVYLRQCLAWLEARFRKEGQTALVQVAKKVQSGRLNDYVMSMELMNAINHNHLIAVTPEDVQAAWDGILSLLVEILKP